MNSHTSACNPPRWRLPVIGAQAPQVLDSSLSGRYRDHMHIINSTKRCICACTSMALSRVCAQTPHAAEELNVSGDIIHKPGKTPEFFISRQQSGAAWHQNRGLQWPRPLESAGQLPAQAQSRSHRTAAGAHA